MSAKKRYLALLVSFAMVLTMAFSVFFIARHAEHNCSGEDCSICAQINACINALNNITPKPQAAELFAFAPFAVVLILGIVKAFYKQKSLIDLKVKLSN